MIVEYFADGELATDPLGAAPSDPTLNNVGRTDYAAIVMREHGVAALHLRCWYATGEREQAFVAVANISMDTLKEVCEMWLRTKYGDVEIKWFQSLDERNRTDATMWFFHAKFKTLPRTLVID